MAGKMDMSGNLNINDKFKVNSLTGSTYTAGVMDISGSTNITGELNLA
jgi:hypothetical protein